MLGASQLTVQLLNDSEGAIEVGWVGQGVFLAQFDGALSERLGAQFVEYLRGLVLEGPLQYFADGSALTRYDLLARSAFFRLVLEHRSAFANLTILTWAEGISPAAHAFMTLVGQPIDILSDPLAFERRLLDIAPEARYRLVEHRRSAPSLRHLGSKSSA